jgi:hypothetical protein
MRVFLGALVAVCLLSACQEDRRATEDLTGPERVAVEFQSCEKKGGRFSRAGKAGVYTCVLQTRDAGKTCTMSSQCESACLARSRTCAPLTPLLGCNDILNNAGVRLTQCVE